MCGWKKRNWAGGVRNGSTEAKRAQEMSLAKEEHVLRSLGLKDEVSAYNSCHFFLSFAHKLVQ